LEERYSFADALAVATYLNIFIRNCNWVKMANLAQMVNAIAPIVTTTEGAVVQPIYYPFLLHSTAALDEAVDVHVSSPTIDGPQPVPGDRWKHRIGDLAPFSTIDSSATADAARGRLAVTIVNRDPGSSDEVEIRLRDGVFKSQARVRTITGEGKGHANRPAPDIEGVRVEDGSEEPKGDTLIVTVPSSSFTVIEVPIAAG
jgi:alpha-N-arabinofuranosidase